MDNARDMSAEFVEAQCDASTDEPQVDEAAAKDKSKPFITREQIEEAAEKAGVPPDQIDDTVKSLSEYLGWDITQGYGSTPS